MTARGVIIDAVTGVILRKIVADPAMFAIQAGTGEELFALVNDDGAFIDDANLVVNESGEWEVVEGAPDTVTPPGATMEYVAV